MAHPWFAYNYDEAVHQPDNYMTLVEMSREGLAKLMDLGKEYNIRYVLETHDASCFASPLAVPWILKDFDPKYCGVIYDPANTMLEGFVRPRGAVEIMGDYIAYIHAKNIKVMFRPHAVVPRRRLGSQKNAAVKPTALTANSII